MDLDFKQYIQYGKHSMQAYRYIKKIWRWKKRLHIGKKRKKQKNAPMILVVQTQKKPKTIKIHHTKLLGQIVWAVKNRYF